MEVPGYGIEPENKKYLCDLINQWGLFEDGGIGYRDENGFNPTYINELKVVFTDKKQPYYGENFQDRPIWSANFSVDGLEGIVTIFIGEQVLEKGQDEASFLASGYLANVLYLHKVLAEHQINQSDREEALSIRRRIHDERVKFFEIKKDD